MENLQKAVLVETARCIGSGSDQWKRINGLTKPVLEKVKAFGDGVTILVPSHTEYNGQHYKKAVAYGSRFCHRQINDADFQIIGAIN